MDRVGGINFHPRKAGGYRPNAGFEILVGETELNQALGDGIVFFDSWNIQFRSWAMLIILIL